MRLLLLAFLVALLPLSACSIKQELRGKMVATTSGKEIKVTAMGPVVGKDWKALQLMYETKIDLADEKNLAREVADIWKKFIFDAETGDFKSALITAQMVTSSMGGLVKGTKQKSYVFKKDKEGKWGCTDKLVPPLPPEYVLVIEGDRFMKKGDFKQGLEKFNKAVELKPDYVLARVNRSGALVGTGDYDKAIEDCNKALDVDPKCSLAFSNRATAYLLKEEFKKAVDDCTSSIKIQPTPAAYSNRSAGYAKLNQFDKGVADATKSLELNPQWQNGFLNRGLCYYHLKKDKLAIDDLTKAISLLPSGGEAYFYRGKAYERQGDKDKASQDLSKAEEFGFTEGSNQLTVYDTPVSTKK